MADPITNPEEWHAPPMMEAFEELRKRGPAKGSRWINDGSLSPLDLYVYLKARFGDPNGILMASRSPTSENLIQWHYSIVEGDERIEIMGTSTRLEVVSSAHLSNDDWQRLAANVKKDFSIYSPAMKKVRKALEKWTLFINPFHRLDRIVEQYTDLLTKLDLQTTDLPKPPRTADVASKYYEEIGALVEKFAQAATAGTVLRMLAPVLGEAFINVLIFLLVRPEIKKDERLYKNLIRQEVDIRVKNLPLQCVGFVHGIDGSEEEVKDFLRVMNARNDFLHGNVDPLALESGEVFFDGTIPLFKQDLTLAERGLLPMLRRIEPDVALRDVKRVRTFIDFTLSRLDEQTRHDMRLFLENPQPGWHRDTGRAGILFSAHAIDFIPFEGKGPPEGDGGA